MVENEALWRLVAIGAAVACNCKDCLTYNIAKAREGGVTDDLIDQALEIGNRVRQGATEHMQILIKESGFRRHLDNQSGSKEDCCH